MEELIKEEQVTALCKRWNVSREWLEENYIYPRLYIRWSDIFPDANKHTLDKLIAQMIEARHYRLG